MDMEKFMNLLAQSPEFMELVNNTRIELEEREQVEAEASNIRQVKRARVMEPLRDEGEWLLTSEPAGDD